MQMIENNSETPPSIRTVQNVCCDLHLFENLSKRLLSLCSTAEFFSKDTLLGIPSDPYANQRETKLDKDDEMIMIMTPRQEK